MTTIEKVLFKWSGAVISILLSILISVLIYVYNDNITHQERIFEEQKIFNTNMLDKIGRIAKELGIQNAAQDLILENHKVRIIALEKKDHE